MTEPFEPKITAFVCNWCTYAGAVEDDPDTLRFFELLKVKLRAQALAVSEVAVDKGQLKFRLSPQTPLDPAKLMAWVGQTKGASLSPDGAVRLPVLGTADGPILQAQRVLASWTSLG